MSVAIRTVSAVDAVANAVRNRLFSGDPTGLRQFTEAAVAADYDVARPTAKAAIERLVNEGILTRGSNKTARVPAMNTTDINDLYAIRGCLEAEVIRRLSERRSVPDDAIRANAEIRAVGSVSSSAVVAPDVRFHLSLVEAIASPRMERLYGAIMGEVRLCMAQVQSAGLLRASTIANEHRLIVKHLRAGDTDAACAALARHLDRARRQLVRCVDEAGTTAGVSDRDG